MSTRDFARGVCACAHQLGLAGVVPCHLLDQRQVCRMHNLLRHRRQSDHLSSRGKGKFDRRRSFQVIVQRQAVNTQINRRCRCLLPLPCVLRPIGQRPCCLRTLSLTTAGALHKHMVHTTRRWSIATPPTTTSDHHQTQLDQPGLFLLI